MALAREWYELQKPMVDTVGAGTWNKAVKMYEEMEERQSDATKAPFSSDVYGFIAKAADAARLRGIFPPRMAAA